MNAISTVSLLSRALMRLLLVCFLFTLSGCVHDISHDPRGRNSYIVGAVYRVKRPLTFSRTALSNSAIVLDDHISVSPGTLLCVTRLLLTHQDLGTCVWVKAVIVDGPWAATPVELAYTANRADTNLLELVRKP